MTAAMAVHTPELQLPWESSAAEDRFFNRLLLAALALFLLAAIVVPLLPVEERTREQEEDVPPHLARVLLEKKELPKPEVVKPKPKEQPKPEPKPKEIVPPTTVKEEVRAVNQVELARDKAKVAGVLAFQDDLMAMRESLNVQDLNQSQSSRGESSAAKLERKLITAENRGSGGINTADVSRDAGGPALSGREATRVESNITAGTGKKEAKNSSQQLGGRSDESIRRVMDRNKGAIFAVYNRALRQDPLLEGKVVFNMVIEPSGEISSLELVSSELHDEALTRKILARIRMIRFGAESVLSTRVNYSFDFLPYG